MFNCRPEEAFMKRDKKVINLNLSNFQFENRKYIVQVLKSDN